MRAVLLTGIERKKDKLITTFSLECVKLYSYLFKKLHITKEKIYFFIPKELLRLKLKGILKNLKQITNQNPLEPLLIYFNGHGFYNEWCFYKKDGFCLKSFNLSHKKLINALKKQKGPLIIIADCCHAMSLSESLEKLKCEKLLIGLSPKNELGFDGLLDQILEKWKSGNVADPLYDNGHRKIRYIKRKTSYKSKYCLLYGNDKKFHRYYYDYVIRKIRIVLREGDNLDYIMYPKK